ncbi:hypothetical protein [Butyrivibrio sp. XPD2002]|uniref:hypothetical protein n=1 Tax=Butyrivibrio sp. XPD2002 TaxID=1280665 RepID=UPI00042137ED|nr:hypothetical protein [Butyrivibrio sp. XPD2002]
MTKKELFKFTKETFKNALTEMGEINKKMDSKKKDLKNPDYSRKRTDEIHKEITDLRWNIQDIKNRTLKEISKEADNVMEELRNSDAVRGESLTDDAKLFNCGVELSPKDVQGILDRNKGNSTMEQLTYKYAEAHNISLTPTVYIPPYETEIEDVKNLRECARICLEQKEYGGVVDAYARIFPQIWENAEI